MRLLWEEFLSLEDGTVAGQEAKLPLFSSGKVLAPPHITGTFWVTMNLCLTVFLYWQF